MNDDTRRVLLHLAKEWELDQSGTTRRRMRSNPMLQLSGPRLAAALRELRNLGLVDKRNHLRWIISPLGLVYVQRIYRTRGKRGAA